MDSLCIYLCRVVIIPAVQNFCKRWIHLTSAVKYLYHHIIGKVLDYLLKQRWFEAQLRLKRRIPQQVFPQPDGGFFCVCESRWNYLILAWIMGALYQPPKIFARELCRWAAQKNFSYANHYATQYFHRYISWRRKYFLLKFSQRYFELFSQTPSRVRVAYLRWRSDWQGGSLDGGGKETSFQGFFRDISRRKWSWAW